MEKFFTGWFLRAVIFPGSILLLALAEENLKRVVKPLAWLGDISYSSYMLHFPLQLCFVLFVSYANFQIDFRSVPAFLTFLLLLIGISLASFHWLERPAQSFLRSRGEDSLVRRASA